MNDTSNPSEGNLSSQGNPDAVTSAPAAPELPEKYRGKTPHQLATMHQELERKLGSQGSEIGELRKAITEQQRAAEAANQEPLEDLLYTDPKAAINRVVEERLRPFEELSQQQQVAAYQGNLDKETPGWREVLVDPAFGEWVGSSAFNTKLLEEANNFDTTAAKALFEGWQQKNGGTSAVTQAVKQDRKRRAAVTEAPGAPSIAGKTFKRSDIQALAATNQQKYQEMLPEINQARREGRVIDG